jgi:hypothetical protein
MRLNVLIVAALLASSPWHVLPGADEPPKRLKPSAFPELPPAVRTELSRRGCTIPQPDEATHPENVIHGRFTTARQTDWAVLCSVRGNSAILVFRGGSVSAVARIAALPDSNERELGVADAAFIRQHYDSYGGPKPPPLDHEGIEDIAGMASEVRYWYRGRWLKLTGAN